MREVLITGANRGLGYALTKGYIETGKSRVFAVVRKSEAAKRLEEEFNNSLIPIVVDLGNDDCIQVLQSVVKKHTDRLDIVINNAGVPSRIADFCLDSISTENIQDLLNIHTLGAIRVVKSTIDFLKNGQESKIINVSSRLASIGNNAKGVLDGKYSYAYRLAKAALNMFTASLSVELKPCGICTAAIHPGRFQSGVGPSEGDLTADVAAKHIIEWIETISLEDSGSFVFPRFGELPW